MAKRVKRRHGQQPDKLANNWQKIFLENLGETSNVTRASAAAGVDTSFAYKVRREHQEFRRKWGETLLEGYEHLELETLQRLRFGSGPDEPKFDIANALRLLTAHRETIAKERAKRGTRDKADVLASLNAKIDKMRERKLAAQKLLMEEGENKRSDDGRP